MAKPVAHYGKWRIRFKDYTGTRRSAVFDDYQSALDALTEAKYNALQARKRGGIGLIEGKTFIDLCRYWIAHRVPLKRSGEADRSIITNHLLPFLKEKPLLAISVEDFDLYKGAKLSDLNPKTVHNHLTLLISMLNLAKELHWVERIPKIKKPKCSILESDFRYLRNADEIRRFLLSAQEEGDRTYSLYATAIYTGMRLGELAGLRWSDIDFEGNLITVQRSFSGPTKSGKTRYVPLLDELKLILKKWRLQSPTQFVFMNRDLKPLQPSDRVFQETLHRTLDRARFPELTISGRKAHYIRFHDLRHTFASHWVMNGGDVFKLQKILGHQSIQMTMRYAHLCPNAYREDLTRLTFDTATTATITPLLPNVK